MINPKTGEEMVKPKKKIICYKLSESDLSGVTNAYKGKYNIIDASDCFEDVLAIPSVIVFINPNELTEAQFSMLYECFKYDNISSLVFSQDPNKCWDFSFFIDEDLNHARISWENGYDKDALEDKWLDVLTEKEQFLLAIRKLISTPDNLKYTIDKIVTTENNSHLYSYINRMICHLNALPSKNKVQFRQDVTSELNAIMTKYNIGEDYYD